MSPSEAEVPYGTLDLMVLKTLDAMGPLHGYGIARRIEQVAQGALALNQGTIYPALLRLEQKGWIRSAWGTSENNRRARFYSITRARTPAAGGGIGALGPNSVDRGPDAEGRVVTRLRVLLSRLADVVMRSRRDDRIDEEIDTHLALLADDYVRSRHAGGRRASCRAARLRAHRARRRHIPGSARPAPLDALLLDLRLGVRLLGREWRFAAAAILVLSAASASTRCCLTILNAHTIRGLPIAGADRVMHISLADHQGRRSISRRTGCASWIAARPWRRWAASPACRSCSATRGTCRIVSRGRS